MLLSLYCLSPACATSEAEVQRSLQLHSHPTLSPEPRGPVDTETQTVQSFEPRLGN